MMRSRTWKVWSVLALGAAILAVTVLWSRRPSAVADPSGGGVTVTGPDVVLHAAWGGEDGQLGKDDGDQSNPEGPMSFVATPFDELFVLDQVNQRIARFEARGAYLGALPLPARTFQDLSMTADGVLVVLDRLARQSLLLLTPDGGVLDEVPILGEAIPEGGAVTAMFVQDDGVWLEVGHSYRVHVLDDALLPAPRKVRSGRAAAAPGLDVVAALDGKGGAALWLQDADDNTVYAETSLTFAHDVARIAWLAADDHDRLAVALHLWTWSATDPTQVTFEEDRLLVFDPYLSRVAELAVPWVVKRWEQFREFTVSPEGIIHQMAFDRDGVRIRRWRMSW